MKRKLYNIIWNSIYPSIEKTVYKSVWDSVRVSTGNFIEMSDFMLDHVKEMIDEMNKTK